MFIKLARKKKSNNLDINPIFNLIRIFMRPDLLKVPQLYVTISHKFLEGL